MGQTGLFQVPFQQRFMADLALIFTKLNPQPQNPRSRGRNKQSWMTFSNNYWPQINHPEEGTLRPSTELIPFSSENVRSSEGQSVTTLFEKLQNLLSSTRTGPRHSNTSSDAFRNSEFFDFGSSFSSHWFSKILFTETINSHTSKSKLFKIFWISLDRTTCFKAQFDFHRNPSKAAQADARFKGIHFHNHTTSSSVHLQISTA